VPDRPVPAATNEAARRHRVEGGRPHAVAIRFTNAAHGAVALISGIAARRRLTGSLPDNANQVARLTTPGDRPDARVTAPMDPVPRACTWLDLVLAWPVPAQPAALRSRSGQPEGDSAPAERLRPGGTTNPGQRNASPGAPT
jgi:hypothetical protein